MRVKTVIKRILIGIAIFFVAMIVLGIILQITGYEPPAKTESATERPKTANESAQVPEPEAQQPDPIEPTREALTETLRQQPVNPVEPQKDVSPEPEPKPALLEPIDPARTDIDPSIIKYDIISVEPGHIGVIQRYSYRVVVYQRLNKTQLVSIADVIYRYAQKETPFNAIKIIFHDYPQISARLGYVDYAPNGKWEDARTVKTGNYSKMKMIDHLFEPDWSKAISERDANIYTDYMALERQYSEVIEREIEKGINTTGYNPMERALPDIARQYNMSENDVFSLIMKASQSYEKKP
jgi:hypothetical protein